MKGARIRTDISTLKMELMSDDLQEDLCYGGKVNSTCYSLYNIQHAPCQRRGF